MGTREQKKRSKKRLVQSCMYEREVIALFSCHQRILSGTLRTLFLYLMNTDGTFILSQRCF